MSESEYALLSIELSKSEHDAVVDEAKRTSLPPEGVLLLRLADQAIADGAAAPSEMMSAQEHLSAIADVLERDGVHEDDLPDLVIKLRMLSDYATTRIIPMDPWKPPLS